MQQFYHLHSLDHNVDVARGGENMAAQRLLPYTAAQRLSPWMAERYEATRTQGDAQKARERERQLQRAHSHRARRRTGARRRHAGPHFTSLHFNRSARLRK